MATEHISPAGILYGFYSDEGQRPNQEDRYVVEPFTTGDGLDALLALVADGIGGQSTGELASNLAKETIPAYLKKVQPTASEMTDALVAAIEEANARIYQESLKDMSRAGMGTTCTAVVIIGKRLYLAHVGDSRAYLLRHNKLRQLTIDHTWAEEALRHGRSLEEIRNHPNRGVLKRFLGIEPQVEVDTRYRASAAPDDLVDCRDKPLFLENTDAILLNTDGVSDVLPDPQIETILSSHPAPKAAEELVKAALKAGASDNVTAVVMDMPEAQKKAAGAGAPKWVWAAAAAGILLLLLIVGGVIWAQRSPAAAESTAMSTRVVVPQVTAVTTKENASQADATPTALAAPGVNVNGNAPQNTPIAYETPPLATSEPITGTSPTADAPTPTLIVATPTPPPTPTSPPGPSSHPTQPASRKPLLPKGYNLDLLEPPEGVTGDAFTLKWQANKPLSNKFAFEPVVWSKGKPKEIKQNGASPSGKVAITQYTAPVKISSLESKVSFLKSGETYYWSICVIQNDSNKRIKCAPGRAFIYQKQGSGGGQPQPTQPPPPSPQPTQPPPPSPQPTQPPPPSPQPTPPPE